MSTLCIQVLLCWAHIYLQLLYPLLWLFSCYYVVSLHISCNSFILKSIISNMDFATPAFFWFPFAWNIFFRPLNFSLYMSLGLKWVSYWQHICESCFCIHSASLCVWLEHLIHLHIRQVLITMIPLPLNLLIRFCYCRSFILLFFLSREFQLAFVINLIC